MLPFSWARQVLSIFGSPITPLQQNGFSQASRLALQVGERKIASNMWSHLFSQPNLLWEGVSNDSPFPFSSRESLPSAGSTLLSKSPHRWGGDPQVLVSDLSPPKAELACSQLRTIAEKSGVSFLKTSPSGSMNLALLRVTSCASLRHPASKEVRVQASLLY